MFTLRRVSRGRPSRRDFLQLGTLATTGLTMAHVNQIDAQAAESGGRRVRNKSVIWLWLGGGPTHVETFDPKPDAPVEFRSMTGEVVTRIPGVTFGGTFPMLASVADKMTVLRSYQVGHNSHAVATKLSMTGHNDANNMKPSLGSMVAHAAGALHPRTGMPTYMRYGGIGGDGPGWLGRRYMPFSPNGEAAKSMANRFGQDRLDARFDLLDELDRMDPDSDASGQLAGLDGFTQQAYGLITRNARQVFDISQEPVAVRERYGPGLGATLLQARRGVEAGVRFVTATHSGWDMHGNLVRSIRSRSQDVDRGVSALITDLHDRGMLDDTLVVITGEFGRTPRINKNKDPGRDHWGALCTMALAGGGLQMSQVIGASSAKAETPSTNPIRPQDVMATILEMFGIGHRYQVIDPQGRPMYLVENGAPIEGLL